MIEREPEQDRCGSHRASDGQARVDGGGIDPAPSPSPALNDATFPARAPTWGPRFDLGQVVMTTNAASVLPHNEVLSALARHVRGDWGTLGAEDRAANDQAVQRGGRILSAYDSGAGIRFWILTEADRSVTTVLLPEDY